ncbi:MAG: hypothetical protein VX983_04595 [Actinomycetota bacterium]|nr:hypothetical protein [Acidimicrobiales bacterium]MED5541348.1 hypothetical protein [Actinomycetota bacterium]MEE3186267.1 hypothetical protein [Actinomycetota bacterium]|tara:strand:- start:1251 stop:1544 length:294 start_codon:yes stop_codon:yes gene_type:complete
MTVQLRRYEVEDGGLERLVAWFPTIAAVRDKYGFTIEFAYADADNSEFVWAVSYPGDVEAFETALEPYNESPERADAFAGFSSPVAQMHLSYVTSAL